MRISTDLLFNLARGVEAPFLTADDGDLEISKEISPVLVIPKAAIRNAAFSSTEQQRSSFQRNISITMPASTAVTSVVVATLAQGLWLLRWFLSHQADFTRAPTDGGVRFSLRDPGATEAVLVLLHDVANVPQNATGEGLWLFVDGGWDLNFISDATGAAQTKSSTVTVQAVRLL